MTWESSVVVGLVGINFLMFWTAFKLDEKHWAVRLLSYFLGWGFILLIIGMLREIVEFDAPTATSVVALLNAIWYSMMMVFFGLFFYFVIVYVIDYYKANLKKGVKAKRAGGM